MWSNHLREAKVAQSDDIFEKIMVLRYFEPYRKGLGESKNMT